MDLILVKADITTLDVDCIVNAANSKLMAGSGVCGAIHKAAGRELEIESIKLGPIKAGDAVITSGYNLKAKFIIHTVGPIYREYSEHLQAEKLLASCYKESLRLADSKQSQSIAFPAISTGVYGYPKKEAAQVAIQAVKESSSNYSLSQVFFCVFDDENHSIYKEYLSISRC